MEEYEYYSYCKNCGKLSNDVKPYYRIIGGNFIYWALCSECRCYIFLIGYNKPIGGI